MRVVRAADCRRMPWKNGGGETVEIATYPEGAGLDSFVWRLSAARVARDGPFSVFPGIERTLAVVSGDGMDLQVGGEATRLGPDDPPLRFAGDRPTEARLLGGPVEDLNIMTRHGVARHRMRRVAVQGPAQIAVLGQTVLAYCPAGGVTLEEITLQARDTVMLTEAEGRTLAVDGQGTLYVIAIDATGPSFGE